MNRSIAIAALLLGGVAGISQHVSAQTFSPDLQFSAALAQTAMEGEASAPGPFSLKEGSWNVSAVGGYYQEQFSGGNERLSFGGAAIEYFVCDNFAMVGELLGVSVDQNVEDAAGFAGNLLGRCYLLKPMEGVDLFLEGGAGILEADRRVPLPNGTHHNFTLHFGVGARVQIAEQVSLIASGRYLHLSNASLHGENRNPSIDALGVFGGLMFGF